MIRLNLMLFGGRGGDATSASWMGGFFKYASRGAKSEAGSASDDVKAAKSIYNKLARAKRESNVMDIPTMPQERILKDWAKQSTVAHYDSENLRLSVAPGKLTQARREFEKYAKQRFKSYYLKGRPKVKRGISIK